MATAELSPGLQKAVDDISAVSGYIWLSGWSAANGGNLSLDVTELASPDALAASSTESRPLPTAVPALAGRLLFVTVSGSRFRDLPRDPAKALLLMRISEDGTGYHVLWGGEGGGKPTLEFIPHLKVHASLRSRGVAQFAVLHAHPTHLIAMTHLPEYRNPDYARVLQTSQTTAKVFLGEGVGMARYMPMGSEQLGEKTVELMRGRRAVMWERHGCIAVGRDVFEAFDVIDLLEKAAQTFLLCITAGYEPRKMSPDEIATLGG